MIINFADNSSDSDFSENTPPELLTTSYITVDFSKHTRLLHNHHDRLELLFIRTGFGSYFVDDEQYPIRKGDLIITNAGVVHDEIPEYNHHLSMLSVGVDNVFINGLPKNHLISDKVQPVLNVNKDFELFNTMFQSIFEALAPQNEKPPEITQHLTRALLSLTLYSFKKHGQVRTLNEKSDSTLLRDIKNYIDEYYYENLSIPAISDKFYISQSYLSHLFKRKLGYSPMQYIARRKIGEAQTMLIFTDKSITEIAFAVGYDNLSHFNVQFKKHVGLPPLAYRDQYLRHESEQRKRKTP